jgi:ATP-dependent Clp protease ATP-binding subunit ClpA
VFERFTERPRNVVVLAQEEARSPELKHNYIGTEHILLGLIAEETGVAVPTRPDLDRGCEGHEGVAVRVLQDFGVDAERTRNEVIRMLSSPEARAERARAEVTYVSSETSIHVNPSAIVHRLLMSGAARALDDGRSQFECTSAHKRYRDCRLGLRAAGDRQAKSQNGWRTGRLAAPRGRLRRER